MQIPHKLVHDAFERAIEIGLERGHAVACAVVDGSGRQIGVLRHDDALWVTPEIALGKATLASAYRNNTGAMFERLQRERPLYGTSVASLSSSNKWFLAEGAAAVVIEIDGKERCLGAVGISGCFPATVDQEIADEIIAWIKEVLPNYLAPAAQ